MEKVEMWGIVDLFGHQKVAGLITEAQIGGCAFVRIDVPAVNGSQAVSHFYGNGAIYSITPTSEELAKLFVEKYKPAPISVYIPEIRQLKDSEQTEED